MKKSILVGVAALLAGVAIAATWGTGEGKIISASTAHGLLTFTTTLNTVSVKNTDATNTVFMLVNASTNTLITRIAAGTALPVLAGDTYVWDAQGNAAIKSLAYATTNGTAVCVVAGY